MRTLRLLLADRLNSGIFAAFLIYALLAQSVAGSIASARMTGMPLAHAGIDCATSAPLHSDHDGSQRLHECCAVLCQTACGLGAGFLFDTGGADLGPAHVAFLAAPVIGRPDPSHPRRLGIRREARAPPYLSA